MERQRIPNPLRSLRRPGALRHLKLHPTFAAGVHDERFPIEVEQRVEGGIAHIRLHECYHWIITLSTNSLLDRLRTIVAAPISAIVRRRAAPCGHAQARELPDANEGKPSCRQMWLFLRPSDGCASFVISRGGIGHCFARALGGGLSAERDVELTKTSIGFGI